MEFFSMEIVLFFLARARARLTIRQIANHYHYTIFVRIFGEILRFDILK